MREFFALVFAVLLAVTASDALAKSMGQIEHATRAPMAGEWDKDIPARAPDTFARQDTIDFGNYQIIGGEYYAVVDGVWDFEDGADGPGMGGPSLQGWYSIDLTANPGAYWRHITDAIWSADPFNPSYVPLINGPGCAWVGLFAGEARDLCWDTEGPGYGNSWCQRLTSPTFSYTGSGSVNLSMKYWNDTEPGFDYSTVVLQAGPNRTVLNDPGFDGQIGFDGGLEFPGGANAETYTRAINNNEFGGAAIDFQIIFEFTSDAGWSDEDGLYVSDYGPFAADDVVLTGSIDEAQSFNFDDGLQNWTATACPGEGSFFNIAPLSQYVILDPCVCGLEGTLVHFHNPNFEHDYGQREMAWSPIVDRTPIPNYTDFNRIFADWDQYCEMPMENGVFYRAGWSYYPFVCDATGEVGWSPRIGINTFFYAGEDPICFLSRNIGTDWGLPPDVEQVRFGMELYASCDAFGIGDECSFVTNPTPLYDNFKVRMTGVVNAPSLLFATGCQLHDAFGAAGPTLNINDAANVNVTYNRRMGSFPDQPPLLGDSLVVNGPAVVAGQGKWESKIWFRLARTGPGQSGNALYNTWRNHPGVNKGFAIEDGEFSYGLMDSAYNFQGFPQRNQFTSYFNETDPGFNWGNGDGDTANENAIFPNLAFTPGTKIEYFITGDYTEDTPAGTYSYLPDTTGAFFLEFEVLPSYRMDGDVAKFPCVLYIDSFNRGAENFIAPALNVVLAGADWEDPIPDPAPWDKYDYFDASSNWKAPMYRAIGGNNGAWLTQMIGYRGIILNTGTFGGGCMWPADWQLFTDWLVYPGCDGNEQLKGFIANGTNISFIMNMDAPGFMTSYAGVSYICNTYNADGCPPGQATDENYCVQLEATPGAVWEPDPFAPIDVFGNWCPPMINYDVLGTTGGGMGNKVYQNVVTGLPANYAQVVKDASADPSNYRVVVDAFSYHTMTMRDLDVWPDPELQCPVEEEPRVEAAYNEIREQLKWVLNMSEPQNLGLCLDPCGGDDSSVPGGPGQQAFVNRLEQNHPNPFNPRTTISFSLAQAGPTQLVIYDVSGRKVRTLVDGHKDAGPHTLVWDGLDDSGRPVASGVFWSQLAVDGFSSNKKMVVLK